MTNISREQMLKNIQPEDSRLSYDGNDENRLRYGCNILQTEMNEFVDSVLAFIEATKENEEDTSADIRARREDMIIYWARLQVALSGMARTIRVDADEAYSRMVRAIENPDKPLVMQGL